MTAGEQVAGGGGGGGGGGWAVVSWAAAGWSGRPLGWRARICSAESVRVRAWLFARFVRLSLKV